MESTILRTTNHTPSALRYESTTVETADFLERVDGFINDHPHWVMYIRGNRKFKCPVCYSEEEGTYDPRCKTCFGIGHKFTIHKLKVRDWDVGQSALGESTIGAGSLAPYKTAFAMHREYYPAGGDHIIDPQWDMPISSIGSRGKPLTVDHMWTVSDVAARRLHGRVMFHVAYCKSYEGDKAWMETFILQKGNIYSSVAAAADVHQISTTFEDDIYGDVMPSVAGTADDEWELNAEGDLQPKSG